MKKTIERHVAAVLFSAFLVMSGCARKTEVATSQPPANKSEETLASGLWTYRVVITNPGTRSQGRLGELLHGGKSIPTPAGINDFVESPWGFLYWQGAGLESGLNLWEDQGWMRKPRPGHEAGHQIREPGGSKET